MFHCCLTVDVSSVVDTPWRCGVLTTKGGTVGAGLGHPPGRVHDPTAQSAVGAPRLLKRSLPRLYCCCSCGCCGCRGCYCGGFSHVFLSFFLLFFIFSLFLFTSPLFDFFMFFIFFFLFLRRKSFFFSFFLYFFLMYLIAGVSIRVKLFPP